MTIDDVLKLIDENIGQVRKEAKYCPIGSMSFKLFQSTAWAFEFLKEEILERLEAEK